MIPIRSLAHVPTPNSQLLPVTIKTQAQHRRNIFRELSQTFLGFRVPHGDDRVAPAGGEGAVATQAVGKGVGVQRVEGTYIG